MPRPRVYERTERRACGYCRCEFDALTYNIRRGWGRFCSKACACADIKARPRRSKSMSIRQLRHGEPVPPSEPKRYRRHGYVVLRWLVGVREYVECLEHRVVAGVMDGVHVHHKNGCRSDNRLENLEILTPTEHAQHHHPLTWDVDEAARLYASGMSLPVLGRHLGVSHENILRVFQKRGIPRRSIGESLKHHVDLEVFRDLYGKGMRLDAMAKHLDIGRIVLDRVRRELGLPAFPCGRPKVAV